MKAILVIGGDMNGLIAAIYLARAGHSVTVLEADRQFGGAAANRVPVGSLAVPSGPGVLEALDPRVLKDLKLSLSYASRDLPLIGLRAGAAPLILPREVHDARRALTPISERDAERFSVFRREHYAIARAMRSVWWDEGELRDDVRAHLRRLSVTAATAWLDGAFETDALRASYAFDALGGGLSPAAAGSALLFTWRAAQEMSGLQGAVAVPVGGTQTLVDQLLEIAEASGVRLRSEAKVARLDSDGESVKGAILEDGEIVPAGLVVSSLSRRKTLVGFLPPGAAGLAMTRHLAKPQATGEARVLLGMNALPPMFEQPARYIVAERLETASLAFAEARSGQIPSDLAFEVVALPTGSSPPYVLSIAVRPVPVDPAGGWKENATKLVQAALRTLEQHVPHFLSFIGGLAFVPPRQRDPFDLVAMTSPWRTRVETPLHGLYLCGETAEPVPCFSGRAARIAAAMIVRDLKEASS